MQSLPKNFEMKLWREFELPLPTEGLHEHSGGSAPKIHDSCLAWPTKIHTPRRILLNEQLQVVPFDDKTMNLHGVRVFLDLLATVSLVFWDFSIWYTVLMLLVHHKIILE